MVAEAKNPVKTSMTMEHPHFFIGVRTVVFSSSCYFFGDCNRKTVRFLPDNAVLLGPHDLLCVYVFSCAADVIGWNTFLPFQNDNSTNYFPTGLCVVSTRITERTSIFAFESPCIWVQIFDINQKNPGYLLLGRTGRTKK